MKKIIGKIFDYIVLISFKRVFSFLSVVLLMFLVYIETEKRINKKHKIVVNACKLENELLIVDNVFLKYKDSLHIIENRLIYNYDHPQFDSIIELNKKMASLDSLRSKLREGVYLKYVNK